MDAMDPFALPPDLAAVAERELNETPAVRERSLAEMRERLAKAPLNAAWLSEPQYLIMFLRHGKVRERQHIKKTDNRWPEKRA